MADRWSDDTLYIDLTKDEALWWHKHITSLDLHITKDDACRILAKLTDSMREAGMAGHTKWSEIKHKSRAGTDSDAYAEEGKRYYRKAAWAQIAIGVGAVLQAVAVIYIAWVLS